jgi:hypothetical protein
MTTPLQQQPLVEQYVALQRLPPPEVVPQQPPQPTNMVVGSSSLAKQQTLRDISAQLTSLRLQEQEIQQAMQQLCWQLPRLSLQECSMISKQLNSNSRDLKMLLLAVCTGWCGNSSSQLFTELTTLAEQHNEDVLQAAAAGVSRADRYKVDVLGLKEQRFGRTLLHLLVSEFPATVVLPDGSLQLHGPDELAHNAARTAAAAEAAAAAALGDPAAMAAATAVMGSHSGSRCRSGTASRLACIAKAAAAAATASATAAAASEATSSTPPGSSSSSSLLPDVRTQLLQQLRQLAIQRERWPEVLRAENSSGSSAWLTACHWALPAALDFFIADATFDLHDMMFPTKNGKPGPTLGASYKSFDSEPPCMSDKVTLPLSTL